jgi:GTP-binding protein EngB required for normal cell division
MSLKKTKAEQLRKQTSAQRFDFSFSDGASENQQISVRLLAGYDFESKGETVGTVPRRMSTAKRYFSGPNVGNRARRQYPKVKLALVGNEKVGKTVLINRLMNKDEDPSHHSKSPLPTRGVHYKCWEIPKSCHPLDSGGLLLSKADPLILGVWDYAGHHTYLGTHQYFFTREALYLLVFDLSADERKSCESVIQWLRDVEDRVAGATFVLVGTKADKLASKEEAQGTYSRVLYALLTYLNRRVDQRAGTGRRPMVTPSSLDEDSSSWIVGCADNSCIKSLRNALVRHIVIHHRQRYPELFEPRSATSLRVLELLNLRRSGVFVPINYLQEETHEPTEKLESALRRLHEAGICLWYEHDPSLRNFVLNDPEQVSKLLRVLVDPTNVHQQQQRQSLDQRPCEALRQGKLTTPAIELLWNNKSASRQPVAHFGPLLLPLLERLCLTAPPTSNEFLIPLLLPEYPERRCDVGEIIRRRETNDDSFARNCCALKRPVYVLRLKFDEGGLRDRVPHGLFQQLMLRLYRVRPEMLDREEVPHVYASNRWYLYRNCLTDCSWFALYIVTDNPSEIQLRIVCDGADSREFNPESRCLARRVWDALREITHQWYQGVAFSAIIVLEDWDRPQGDWNDLVFALHEIHMGNRDFVSQPGQRIRSITPHPANSTVPITLPAMARELWVEPAEHHPLSQQSHPLDEELEFLKLRIHATILGTGSFGQVHRGSYDGVVVAVKKLNPIDDKDREMVEREYLMHKQFQGSTVLRMYGRCADPDDCFSVYLVLQYARHGSLNKVCSRAPVWESDCNAQGLDVSLRQRVQWLRDVINAVHYLHENNVLHRDIKCDNIMLDESLTAFLGDFGLSRKLDSFCMLTDGVGTSPFKAPEVNDQSYSTSADIYSFGITILQLLLGYCPGTPMHGIDELREKCASHPEYELIDKLCKMAIQCTETVPEMRPSAVELKAQIRAMIDGTPPITSHGASLWCLCTFVDFHILSRASTDETSIGEMGKRAEDLTASYPIICSKCWPITHAVLYTRVG